MNELREQIEDHIVKLLEISQTWPDDGDLRNAQSRHSGDHILALIAEAMLSEDTEDAVRLWLKYWTGSGHDGEASAVLNTALQAAGITSVDAREGGDEAD